MPRPSAGPARFCRCVCRPQKEAGGRSPALAAHLDRRLNRRGHGQGLCGRGSRSRRKPRTGLRLRAPGQRILRRCGLGCAIHGRGRRDGRSRLRDRIVPVAGGSGTGLSATPGQIPQHGGGALHRSQGLRPFPQTPVHPISHKQQGVVVQGLSAPLADDRHQSALRRRPLFKRAPELRQLRLRKRRGDFGLGSPVFAQLVQIKDRGRHLGIDVHHVLGNLFQALDPLAQIRH